MNNIHDYSELRKQIKAEISAAVFKSAKEGITSGLTNAIEEQFKVEAGEIEIDSSKLAEKVSDSIQKAITQGIQKEKIQGVDVSDLISLNPEDLVSKIREMYDEGADETAKGAKRMIAAMKLAEDQGIGKDQIADALDKKIAEFNLYFEDLKGTTRMSQKAFEEFGQNVISIFTDVNHKIDQVVEDSITDFDKVSSALNRNVKKEIKAFNDALSTLSDSDYDKAVSDPKRFDDVEAKVTSGLMSAQRAISILVKQGDKVPGLKDLFDKVLERFVATGGKQDKMRAFWEEITEEIGKGDTALKELIDDLGLLQKDGSAFSIKSGANNLGGLIGADNIVKARKIVKGISGDDVDYNTLKNLQNLLDDAANAGANVSRILEVVDDSAKGLIMTLEEALPGKDVENLIDGVAFNPEFLQASDKAVQKLVSDLKILYDLGAGLDVESGNIKYDSLTDQFYIFDIDTKSIHQNFEEVMGDLKTFFDYQEDLLREGGDTSNADLVKGFKDRLSAVYDASKEVVVAAKKGIQDAQDSHSDAKEFKPLGKDATGGYASGMVENEDRVVKAAEEVVEAAVDATRKATEEAQSEMSAIEPEFEDYDPKAVDKMVEQIEVATESVKNYGDEVNNFFTEFGKLVGSDFATVRDNPRFDEMLGRVDSGEITGKKAVDILLGKDQLEGDRYYTQELLESSQNLHEAAEEVREAKEELVAAAKDDDEFMSVSPSAQLPWDDDFDDTTTALDKFVEKTQEAKKEVQETASSVGEIKDTVKEMSASEFVRFDSPAQMATKLSDKMLNAVRNHSKVAKAELSNAIEKILLEEDENAYRTAAILLASSKEKKEAWEMEGGARYDSVKDYIKKSGQVYINEQIQGDLGDYRKRLNSLMRGKYTFSDRSKIGVDVYLREMNNALNTSFKTLRELVEYLDSPPSKEVALGKLYDQGYFEGTKEELQRAIDDYKKDYVRTTEAQRVTLKRRDENLHRAEVNKKTLYQEEQEKQLKEEALQIDETVEENLDKQAQQEAWLNSVYEKRLKLKEESLQKQQEYNDLVSKEEGLRKKQEFYDSQVGKTLEEEQRLGAIEKYNDVLDDAQTRYTTIEAIVGRINKQNEKTFPTNLEDQIRKAASMMALIERYKQLSGDDYDVNQIGGQKAVDFYSDYYGMTQNKSSNVRGQLSEINQELYNINKQKEEILNARPLFAIEREISNVIDKVKETGKLGPRQKKKFEGLLEEYEGKGGSPFVSKAYSDGTLFSSNLSDLIVKEYTLEDVADSYRRIAEKSEKAQKATQKLAREQEKGKEASQEAADVQGEQQATIENVVESLREQEQAQEKITAEVEKTNEAIQKEDEWTQEEIDQEVKELFSPKVETAEKASVEETVEAVKEEKEAKEEVTQEIKKSAEAQKELNEETKKSSSKSENVPKGPKPPTPESIERQYKEAADKYEKIRQRVPEGLLGAVFNAEDFPNIKGDFNTILQMLDEMSEKASGIASYDLTKESDVERVKKLTKEINEASTDINKFVKNRDLANEGSMTNTFSNIESFLRRNTRLSQEARLTLRGLSKEIQDSFDPNKNNISMTNKRLGEIRTKFATIQVEARRTGQAGGSLLTQTSRQLGFLNERWLGQLLSIRDIIRYLRTMFEEVKGIDSALIELKKVSKDLSFERLEQSLKNSFETARELGVEVKEVVQATADWARLGYGIEDAEALAKVTSLFRNVGDELTLDTASEYLISTLKGFEMVPEQAMNIVDQFNEVANNFAINTAGIGQALERSAASFNAANTDLSESIALVTTANAVAQNPESVGTTFKTLSARIRGAKTELEELGEVEEDTLVTTSKLRDMVKGMTGFDIMEDEETFKSIYEILIGIGKEWDNLTDIERASLGEALAGKRNANVLYAVLGNTEDLEKAYETALGASGSALREQENYMRSLQYSLDVFKTEVSELYSNVLESKSTKRIIDFATKLLDLIVKITDAIPPAIAVGSMFFASFAVGNRDLSAIINEVMDSVIVGIKGITDTIKTSGVKGAGAEMKKAGADFFKYFADGFSDAGLLKSFNESTFSEFKELFGEGGLAGKYGLTFGVETATDDFKVLEQQIGKTFSPETKALVMSGVTSMEAYESSSRSAAAASTALAGATTLLKTALKGLAAIGITLAIGFAIKAIGDLVHREERLAEEADKARSSIEELDNTFKKMNETLDKSGKRFAELAQRVSDLGETSQSQGGLSTDEYKEFLEISNELAEVFPGLQTDITEEGDALLSLNGTVKDITQSLEEYARIQREIADHQMLEEAEKIFKDDKTQYKKSATGGFQLYTNQNKKNVEYLEKQIDYYERAMESLSDGVYRRLNVTTGGKGNANKKTVKLEETRRNLLSQTLSKEDYQRYLNGETLYFNLDEDQLKKIRYAYNQIVLEYKKDILLAQQEIDKANQDLQKYSLAYLRSENLLYQGMTGDEKLLVDKFVQSLTFEDINKEGIKSFDELKDWLQNGIISSIALIDDEETQNAMAKVLSDATLSAVEKVDLIQEILDSLTESGYTKDDALVIFWKSQYAGAVEDYDNAANHILQGLEAGGPGSYYADQMRAKQIAEELTADELAKVMNLSLKPGMIKGVEDLRALLQKTDEAAVTTFKDIGALLSTDVSIGPDFPEVTWGKVKDDLVGMAQAGKLDEDTLKSYKYYDDILNALGISSKEAEEQISDMIDSINLMAQQNAIDILANYKTQVDKLDDAYQKYKNNELIDANTLSALQDTFGDMDSFKEFQQAVMDGQTELQDYFDNMVTEYALENLALSEVTEQTKEWTKQNLIAAGITEESAEKSINAVLANKEAIESNIRAQIEEYNEQVKLDESTTELAISTEDLNKLTAKEVSELLKAANASGTAAQQIALFTLKKELASGKSLRNADDIEYLKELIIQAGVGIELINQLQHLKKVADAQGGNKDEYEAFMKAHPNQGSWDASTLAEYNAKYSDVWGVVEFEKTYDQVWDEVEKKYKEMFNYTENVGLGYGGAMKDAAKSASDAAKEFKEALDKILAMYDAELDAGVISFQTYVDKSRAIIEQYYRDGKLTAQDYYDELASFYEKQVQQYDKVISAVQKKLSEETDALEKQKENVEKSYNEQIEVIQKKIDALHEENDEIDRNMALSKAQ